MSESLDFSGSIFPVDCDDRTRPNSGSIGYDLPFDALFDNISSVPQDKVSVWPSLHPYANEPANTFSQSEESVFTGTKDQFAYKVLMRRGNFEIHNSAGERLLIALRERYRSFGAYFSIFEASCMDQQVCKSLHRIECGFNSI